MDALIQDLRGALRSLTRSPGFTAAAVVTLGLGIGANTTIFSLVHAMLLRPLPYRDAPRLVMLRETSNQIAEMSVALPNFYDWQQQNQVFESMGAARIQSLNLTGREEPLRVQGALVTASFFHTLGAGARIGRVFSPEEDRPGGDPVAVLSEGLWKRSFGSDPRILGKTLRLDGVEHSVVGVMGPDLRLPSSLTELWVPLGPRMADPGFSNRGNHPGLAVVARLRPGVALDDARRDMQAVAARLERQYPDTNTGSRVNITTLQARLVRNTRSPLLALLGSVAFVLLIACANVANLLLVRAAGRQREIAIRSALGAGRWRVVRQLLTESVVLSLCGGAAGLALGGWGLDALLAAMPPEAAVQDVRLDGMVLAFTVGLSMLTGLLFGLAPALAAARPELLDTLKDGARGASAGVTRQRLRRVLTVAEMALALTLLIGAGLMIRSLFGVLKADAGVRVDNVITLQLSLPSIGYREVGRRTAFQQRLLERVRALPGVESVATTTSLPLTGISNQSGFLVGGRPLPEAGHKPVADVASVSPEYFRTLGIPLLKGRGFDERDLPERPLVAVVDTRMVESHWPGEEPIGKQISFNGPDGPWHTVVGVVGHVKSNGVDAESREETYFAYAQNPLSFISLAIHTAGSQPGLAAAVRSEVRALDPDVPLYNVRTLEEWAAQLSPRRLFAALIGLFGATALLLASVGLYGVMAYSVAQRTHELGVRMALGAQQRDVLSLVMREGLALTACGIALGVAGAAALTRFLGKLLFGVAATDPVTFAGTAALLALVALLASYAPARRAARVDPLVALRHE